VLRCFASADARLTAAVVCTGAVCGASFPLFAIATGALVTAVCDQVQARAYRVHDATS
jgi:hypothetical protein